MKYCRLLTWSVERQRPPCWQGEECRQPSTVLALTPWQVMANINTWHYTVFTVGNMRVSHHMIG